MSEIDINLKMICYCCYLSFSYLFFFSFLLLFLLFVSPLLFSSWEIMRKEQIKTTNGTIRNGKIRLHAVCPLDMSAAISDYYETTGLQAVACVRRYFAF